MASFFTRALDRMTPWDRKGEAQRRQQRKKKDEEERSTTGSTLTVRRAPQQDRVSVQNTAPNAPQTPTPQRPTNLFEDLNKGLVLNKQPAIPTVELIKNNNATPAPQPKPGTVIKPQKPKQSLGNRFRDVFDANTEADQYRRARGNAEKGENKEIKLTNPGNLASRTPIVGFGLKAANTGVNQAREVVETGRGMVATATNNSDAAGASFERQDKLRKNYQKNKGGVFNVGTLYDEEGARRGDIKTGAKDIVAPTAVTALDIFTLGKGNVISDAVKKGGKGVARKIAPDVGKATAANYASGDIDARSQGATNKEAVQSGLINSILGILPDVAVPAIAKSLKNRVLPGARRGQMPAPREVVEDLDEAAISASAEAAAQALQPRPISIAQNIPITQIQRPEQPIAVRNLNEPQPLIQEVTGDARVATPDPLIQRFADEAREREAAIVNNAARPDMRIEGVTPVRQEPFRIDPAETNLSREGIIREYADFLRNIGEGNGVDIVDGRRVSNNVRLGEVGSGRMSQAAWRDEAERQIRAGEAPGEIQKAFNELEDAEVQSLLARGDNTEDAPVGRPIRVNEARSIPVREETTVPVDTPAALGEVRVTTQSEPNNAQSAQIAARPTPQLPTEVQEVLDNPRQFNKRQVAAARNQRKLARQMAKTQEQTAEAISRLDEAKNSGQAEGYAPTGEFARGKKGNAYQRTNVEAEAALGREEMDLRSVDDLISEVGSKETFSPGDRRRIQAAIENLAKSAPDDTETRMILKKLQSRSRTELAQGLAMIPRVIRRSASADTLTNRWENKIAKALDNPAKMTDNDFAEIQRANENFTLARDRAEQFNERFKQTGSEADFKAWEQAYNDARKADEDAKFTEVAVAKRVLKGEKGAAVTKTMDDLKKGSGVNTMDVVTANMLSGTATGFRNTFGTELAGIENRIGANLRAKVTKGLFREDVGGYNRKGARLGRKIGLVKLGRDASRRAAIGGKNPIEWAKNWATTINSGGESSIQSQVYSRLGKYYQNQFKEQGYKGKELDMRMRHAMLTDPDAMSEAYLDSAMKSSGLTGLFEKGQTIERAITDYIGRQTDSKTLQNASRLLMRLAVGFPTATTNFVYQSGKRLTAGLPSYIEMGIKLGKGDKAGAAAAFDRGMKETGSGLAILGLGVALGKAGMISGSYPSDPAEREEWEREGKTENAINIGGNWFPIPQGAGMLGLPLLTGAAIGREGDSDTSLKEMYSPENLSKLLPTDQIQGFLNMASGNGAPQDFKNFVASSVRAGTPAGALFNQISKSFDDTKNDTTTKDLWSNIIDQVASGIPGVNNAMDIPDKLDDAGNPIKNPNPLALAFGATSATQAAGQERTAEMQDNANQAVEGMAGLGLLNDPNLQGVLEGDAADIYKKIQQGQQVGEDDVRKIKEGLVKGVSSEGTDTAYLEREQYDTNLAVLKLKRELMQGDKTVKPSSLKDIDTAIKRGEIYRDNEIPYDMISDYQKVGVEEWRKMGDEEEDEYDPDMYQRLWEIDQLMTENGVSYKKGALDKNKYFVKGSGSGSRGRGRGGSGSGVDFTTDFGRLKEGSFAPTVQQYESLDRQSGSVPIIQRVRPNIVHKIGSSG